ncbi:hypothetical protein CR513_20573, partial [Mucuna pruriens]
MDCHTVGEQVQMLEIPPAHNATCSLMTSSLEHWDGNNSHPCLASWAFQIYMFQLEGHINISKLGLFGSEGKGREKEEGSRGGHIILVAGHTTSLIHGFFMFHSCLHIINQNILLAAEPKSKSLKTIWYNNLMNQPQSQC